MESEWKYNVFKTGYELPMFGTLANPGLEWIRAARLVTPLVIGPVTYRSLWQEVVFGTLQVWLRTPDLGGFFTTVTQLIVPGAAPFPRGFNVVADDVPL